MQMQKSGIPKAVASTSVPMQKMAMGTTFGAVATVEEVKEYAEK